MIYLIRHGQTYANKEGVYLGRNESTLTELGKRQHKSVVEQLYKKEIDRIISSPRERCVSLAEAIKSSKGIEGVVDEQIAEIDFGIFEGLTYKQAQEKYPMEWKKWVKSKNEYAFAEGESISSFDSRVAEFSKYLVEFGEKENIAVVTHGGVISSLICNMLDLDEQCKWHFKVNNGSIIKIDVIDGFVYIVFNTC